VKGKMIKLLQGNIEGYFYERIKDEKGCKKEKS
jgi:hypothetical protein